MEERDFIKQYMKDIEPISGLSEDENKSLALKVMEGDLDAKAKLLEGNLYIVPLRVREFLDSNALATDMIQEGNVALIEAVDAIADKDDNQIIANYTEYFSEIIDIALRAYIAEESEAVMSANNMRDSANRLLDITTKFEEEYDRPATLEELSKLMGMDIDEVENILRTSYNAMEIAKNNGENN